MTNSDFDAYRPPEQPRRKRRRDRLSGAAGDMLRRRRRGGDDGGREMSMVDDVEFTSYYGRPIVKAAPWGDEISTYLFLGGVAGGSGLLAFGAQMFGMDDLRRNARFAALGAVGAGTVCLIADLGRPERFLNMMRTVKPTSPMSWGTWILSAYGTVTGIAAVSEADDVLGEVLPLGPLRPMLRTAADTSGVAMGFLGAPLAAYTAALLSMTSTPTWAGARRGLPYLFVSSATAAASGLAMITTGSEQTKPARLLAITGAAGELIAMDLMKKGMHPLEREPLEIEEPGRKLKLAHALTIAGGVGTLLFGKRSRILAAASGAALMAGSALTRFGVVEAGHLSTTDPKYVVGPQRDRLEERRAAGIVDDSITTAG